MALSTLNTFFITIGILTLGYSLVKATHERKYWRVQQGYYLHVTFDVMLYFLIGVCIITFNLVCILRDYFSTNQYQSNNGQDIRTRQMAVSSKAASITVNNTEATPAMGFESQC